MIAAVLLVCLSSLSECTYSLGPADFLTKPSCRAASNLLLEAPVTQRHINDIVKRENWGTASIKSKILCMNKGEYDAFKKQYHSPAIKA